MKWKATNNVFEWSLIETKRWSTEIIILRDNSIRNCDLPISFQLKKQDDALSVHLTKDDAAELGRMLIGMAKR